ncbi:MAG: thiamine pyrophosphate-binding protein [Dehalococcoidia bacterium]|nr:thiamine pyrophosphate-binding protein [Dehalococcoidia bacterium]
MPLMTGGQALIRSLRQEGVQVIFGLPGLQIMEALDAIYDDPGLRFIATRHEQAATYMADGYARVSGQVGVALVVPGVGVYNAAAGLATAYAASSPVLLVAGQVPRDDLGKGRGVLHDVHDQLDIVRPITKWRARVLEPSHIPEAVHDAFRQLKTGRPRPVELEVPHDALAQEAQVELLESERYFPGAGDPDLLGRAARLLAKASHPLIWAGGGVHLSGAHEELTLIAEHLQASVITTVEGKGAISDRNPLSLGVPRWTVEAWQRLVAEADVVLAVGTRFVDAPFQEPQQVIQVDVDPEELGHSHPKALGIAADARLGLASLYDRLQRDVKPRPSRKAEMAALKEKLQAPWERLEPQASLVAALRQAIPDDGILVCDMTQMAYFSYAAYPVYQPGTFLTSSYMGTLGFAFPAALGAKVARPDRAVVALCGDGGFLYNSQEMATAVKEGINVVAVVFNDNAYGYSLRDQRGRFGGRVIGTELHNPDFVQLACAYGAAGVRVEWLQDLERVLREALDNNKPTLIEVPVSSVVWP